MSPAVAAHIRTHTAAVNPTEAPDGRPHHLRRASRANIRTWRNRLTPAEVARVRSRTEPVASSYYAESDW
jgi:hypothetical protein